MSGGIERLLSDPPFGLSRSEKQERLLAELRELTEWHRAACPAYAKILTALGDHGDAKTLAELPFLPTGLFKSLTLSSVPEAECVRVLTSSGTTGQAVSKILLDPQTAALQQRVLALIVSDFIGTARLPMLVIDCPSVLRDRAKFTARGAGILGFSIFGKRRVFALDEDAKLDFDILSAFLEANGHAPFLLFGFTFLVWDSFVGALQKSGRRFDLSNGILIHGGGWKALENRAVTPMEFRRTLVETCGLRRVYDYYGMAEQTGSIFMQCEEGHFHASNFSDLLVRRPADFSVCERGEEGILQTFSILPRSYPGHSLLTGDRGIFLGEDDCPCGRKGAYFSVLGRLKHAETRGCSDTYALEHG